MSEEFGPDFITVTDEDGNDFELARNSSLPWILRWNWKRSMTALWRFSFRKTRRNKLPSCLVRDELF